MGVVGGGGGGGVMVVVVVTAESCEYLRFLRSHCAHLALVRCRQHVVLRPEYAGADKE